MQVWKLKIICHTPKGKAEKCSKGFGMQYFSALNKPIKTMITSGERFYYVYEYEKQKDMEKVIKKKIPNAERSIRNFYLIIIRLKEKGNKMAKKGAWKVEKTRRWILRQLRKKVENPKKFEDFIDVLDLSDKDYMMRFLARPLFEYKILQEGKK